MWNKYWYILLCLSFLQVVFCAPGVWLLQDNIEIKAEDKRDGKEKIEACKKDGVREIR